MINEFVDSIIQIIKIITNYINLAKFDKSLNIFQLKLKKTPSKFIDILKSTSEF